MCIQRSVAAAKGINFVATYENIQENDYGRGLITKSNEAKKYSAMIRSDKQRIMQVLLGL